MPNVTGRNVDAQSLGRTPSGEPNRRRSERLFLTFPIRVEGSDQKGQSFSETTRTLVINRHGARIQLKHPVTPGATLRIVNLIGNREAMFRVVGPTQPASEEGGEWGVECREEKPNIWGIDFPPVQGSGLVCNALLECRQCHTVSLTNMSLVEHDVLNSTGRLTRECSQCGKLTSWGYPEKQVGMPVPGREGVPFVREVLDPPPPSENRRDHLRVALQLPIRVRSYYGPSEVAKSENVSKGGLCFTTDRDYEIGEVLLITCPYEPSGHNIEVRGRVVRRREMKGTNRKVYGICYEREL